MKKLLRFLRWSLFSLIALVAVAAGLFAYFIYAPEPQAPALSGTLSKGTMQFDGLQRTYRLYLPRGLPKGAPLVLVMHGSGEGAGQMRVESGYAYERLADQHGFAVVYPNSYSFDWNDCSKVGDFTAHGRAVDDVGFLVALVDKLVAEAGLDRHRVFATGVSAGGFISIRLALESPGRFRAVAAVSANLPRPENFKCKPTGQPISVMIMDGTKDTIVPYDGGEVNLLGLFYKGGNVHSARESAQYFADLDKLSGPPEIARGAGVTQARWNHGGKVEVALVTIEGGGHGLPQPYYRRPRLLGPSPMAPNGAQMIWDFFSRQR